MDFRNKIVTILTHTCILFIKFTVKDSNSGVKVPGVYYTASLLKFMRLASRKISRWVKLSPNIEIRFFGDTKNYNAVWLLGRLRVSATIQGGIIFGLTLFLSHHWFRVPKPPTA